MEGLNPKSNSEKWLAGRFTLNHIVAEGGMGRVYSATQEPIGRKIALKVLAAPDRGDFRERFLREGASMVRLTHRHIVTVYDYGEANGEFFIAMEYLDGRPLSEALSNHRSLGIERAVRISIQLCSALRVAHKEGFVHRDLKPSNIMLVTEEDYDDDFVKVIDFGLAKVFRNNESVDLTEPGRWVGSPRYMAPEQVVARQADPRTDIYALGAILFQMVTGQAPFSGHTSHEILEQHVNARPPMISEIGGQREHCPELDLVIQCCLAKNPNDRYPAVEDLAVDLRAVQRLLKLTPAKDASHTGVYSITGSSMGSELGLNASRIAGRSASATGRTQLRWAGIVALVLVAAGITVAMLVRQGGRSDRAVAVGHLGTVEERRAPMAATSQEASPRQGQSAVAPGPTPTPAVEPIEVLFVSSPPGAVVIVDGDSIGTTPMKWTSSTRARGTMVSVRLEKPGFEEVDLETELGTEPVVRVTLDKEEMRSSRRQRRARPAAAVPTPAEAVEVPLQPATSPTSKKHEPAVPDVEVVKERFETVD